jgi:5'-methylthioadenosine phosphorylase
LLGSAADGIRHDIDTPFGKPSDVIIETAWSGLPVFLLQRHGPGHTISPTQVPSRANIFAMKKLGVTHIIASGAVGSLREQMKPKDLVIPDQIIDKTTRRVGTFYEKAAVHVEFAEPFCAVLRRVLIESGSGFEAAGSENPQASASLNPEPQTPNPHKVHDRGCYVCMEGPAFSTKAESHMHRLWGGDLIGMTAMPEAKLAKEAEISYALVALVTDYDCWRKAPVPKGGQPAGPVNPSELLAEIIGNLRSASENGMSLIRRAIERIAADPTLLANCPAHEALKLAIWSDKSKIPPEEVELLGPLWMKYFG